MKISVMQLKENWRCSQKIACLMLFKFITGTNACLNSRFGSRKSVFYEKLLFYLLYILENKIPLYHCNLTF